MKWAIIKDGDRKCVRRYIDNMEELANSKYWYIVEAIQKYGINKVLPVIINDRGGYCTVSTEDIIQIVEQNSPPKLSLSDIYSVDDPNFKYGWLSPDCIKYGCDYGEHYQLAIKICEEFFPEEFVAHEDDFLQQKGWIKVDGKTWVGEFSKISNKQAEFLLNNGFTERITGISTFSEYQDFLKWRKISND